ncbi:hypothetical protein ACFOZ1_15220 [Gracilibacillus marinus]|uniref:Uncharacterized protein n=1 Tax=Gracilibacillus marinus TaxID=630535 RepID=A0ABV8VZM5_9BACI
MLYMFLMGLMDIHTPTLAQAGYPKAWYIGNNIHTNLVKNRREHPPD